MWRKRMSDIEHKIYFQGRVFKKAVFIITPCADVWKGSTRGGSVHLSKNEKKREKKESKVFAVQM